MEIWLDTVTTSEAMPVGWSDCEDDCSDCGSNFVNLLSRPLLEEEFQHIRTCLLRQTTPLHIQRLVDQRWLVCNPTQIGRIAVLDRAALSLLEEFRYPSLLSQAKALCSASTPQNVEGAVLLFYRLGFLSDVEHSTPAYQGDEFRLLSVWMHINNACNLNCHYCYISKTSEQMTEDTSRRAVDAVFRSALKQGFQQIKLRYSGGEASLNIANVLLTHDYAAQLALQHDISLHAVLLSNGVALSDRVIAQLKERRIDVMISLDGIGEYHDRQRPLLKGQGSFKYVDRTIKRLLEHDHAPHISVTVTKGNLAGLPDLFTYLLERGLTFSLNYYRENECSAHLADLQFEEQQMIVGMRAAFTVIEQQLPKQGLLRSLIDKANLRTPHQYTCGVGRQLLVIDQHGGIAKCQADIKRVVTSIDADDPLHFIQNDPSGVQGLPVEVKTGCNVCEWRYWCTGGCPQLTYRMTGRNDVKSPNCNIYKTLFPEVVRLEALRLLTYTSPVVL